MSPLPAEIIAVLANFAECFDKSVSDHAVILLLGAILAPGRHTVTAALRIMGCPTRSTLSISIAS